jgi:hypothetical protein
MRCQWLKWRFLLIVLCFLLTGCIQYDLDLAFDSQTHGQWVQVLQWRGGTIAPNSTLESWLADLRDRTQEIGGRAEFLGEKGFQITVPFNNGQELVTQFNQFFNPPMPASPFTLPNGEPIQAEMTLQQGNWLFAIHNRLGITIDLTAIPDLTDTGFALLQGTQLLTGEIHVRAPWGVRLPDRPTSQPAVDWPLMAGERNQLMIEFWVPSPIGIGAGAIALLMLASYGLKYGILARLSPQKVSDPNPQ